MAKLKVNRDKCIGCGTCASLYPDIFKMDGGRAKERDSEKEFSNEESEEIKSVCPVVAIVENNDQ